MSAGLPGLGLGGLFFIFSALLAPGPELWRTLNGRSSLAVWRVVGRQFGQALAMIVGVDLTIRLLYLGLTATGLRDAPPLDAGTVLPLTLIGITSALLVTLLVGAKLAELALRVRSAALPRVPDSLPRPAPLRAASVGGVVALAWFALLAAGASELSPLGSPGGDRPAERRAEGVQRSPSDPAGSPARRVADVAAGARPGDPAAAAARPPAAGSGGEQSGGDASVPVRQPPVEAPPLPATTASRPPTQPPAEDAPPSVAASPARARPPARPPSAVAHPEVKGPPPSAGPPEGSPAPADAGPPQHTGPPAAAGVRFSGR